MADEKTVNVFLTGNGGQSFHEMKTDDSNALETVLNSGSSTKTFNFIDQKSKNNVTIVLEKLFIMETEN